MNSSTSSIFICTNTDNLWVGCATTRCSEIFVSLLERLEIYVDFFFYFSFFVPKGRIIKCRFWWRYLILDIHVKNDVKDVSLTSLNITGAAFLILFSDKTFQCSWSSHTDVILPSSRLCLSSTGPNMTPFLNFVMMRSHLKETTNLFLDYFPYLTFIFDTVLLKSMTLISLLSKIVFLRLEKLESLQWFCTSDLEMMKITTSLLIFYPKSLTLVFN